MEAFVYSWSDNKTAKIYVGVHKGAQTDGYICSSKPMMAEYRERPTDFTRQIIATGTLNDCAVLEVAIIKQLLKNKDTCYNRAAGKMIINDVHPMLGKTHSDATKRKISLNSVGNKGKSFSNEHKKKIGDAQIGNKNHMYGKNHDAIVKEKIALTSKSWIRTEEIKQKIGNANRGKKATQDTILKLQKAHVTQACIVNGIYYFSIQEAHRQTGIGFSTIISWCKNPERKRTLKYAYITECRYANA